MSNAVTKIYSVLIPRLKKCADSLGSAMVFSTLDANHGYLQIELNGNVRDKMFFDYHNFIYQYTCMPFGFNNASVAFQRAMDLLLPPIEKKGALKYIDNISLFSNDSKESPTSRNCDKVNTYHKRP